MRRRTPEQFASWLHDQLTTRGYNLSSARSGGQKQFVEDSGVPRATVSRMLKGAGPVDINTLERIAETLHIPFSAVLVAAGVLDPDELGAAQRPQGHMTADMAADELGITDPTARQVFRGVVDSLKPGNDAG
ncbi:helix-turn-helix domain-containing protein [Streptomyces salyersiae]|uniref:Helix-turn-helix transcriptional regulator n=1 Tax=Streptomyces salyersiae TaxID=3075530 RepID=A0ABU2RVA9_9ACTN|nr:helix-turn-helix transcriptional regulator [Streptomyces sp. DSM 41770]MDT0432766.1 helix-turn-helix transcriptional regulator [Streptomyces sp. DSM 41770]